MTDSPTRSAPPAGSELVDLIELVRQLRAPEGCPWDREQDLASVRAFLIEEAHEAAAAIDHEGIDDLADELGDLLFMTTLTAEIAREGGGPTLPEIVRRAIEKLVARHPHVYGNEQRSDAADVHRAWESRKEAARSDRGESLLDGVADTLPALTAAYRLGQKASGVGFDWRRVDEVIDKLDEERNELGEAVEGETARNASAIAAELGDLLFTVASLARHLGVDPEAALAGANRKFRRRFASMEEGCRRRRLSLSDCDPEQLESLWQEAKRATQGEDG